MDPETGFLCVNSRNEFEMMVMRTALCRRLGAGDHQSHPYKSCLRTQNLKSQGPAGMHQRALSR